MTAKNFAREAQTIPDIWNPDHKEFRLYGKESSSLWKLQYKRKYVKLPDIRNLSDMEENEDDSQEFLTTGIVCIAKEERSKTISVVNPKLINTQIRGLQNSTYLHMCS